MAESTVKIRFSISLTTRKRLRFIALTRPKRTDTSKFVLGTPIRTAEFGTVSLQEFQAAHEKIFKAMDVDKDGTLTLEEIQAFMRGTGKSAAKEHGDH